jgi:hypothetical protein
MTPYRQQVIEPGPLLGLAALGALMEHYVGLVDVAMVVTGGFWILDMAGGTIRAASRGFAAGGLRGMAGAFSPVKSAKGAGKLLACVIVVIVGGALEFLQAQTSGGAYIPVVTPLLLVASSLFVFSILGQVNYFWSELGDKADRLVRRGLPPEEREG